MATVSNIYSSKAKASTRKAKTDKSKVSVSDTGSIKLQLKGNYSKEECIKAMSKMIRECSSETLTWPTLYFKDCSIKEAPKQSGVIRKKGVDFWEPKPSLTNRLKEIYYNENDTRLPWDD